jgi:beta-galactosidase
MLCILKSKFCRFVVFFSVLFAAVIEAHGLQIENILAFSGTNSVRIVATFTNKESLRNVEVTGRITQTRGSELLWEGSLGKLDLDAAKSNSLTQIVSGLAPQLWGLASPTLYRLAITATLDGKVLAANSVRFGFRSFESRNGQFLLNGHPVFLRGLAINPPGRTVPDATSDTRAFAEAYVRYMKSKNFNTIRLSKDSQTWFDVCDELGMMVFQGQYASPLESVGKKKDPPTDFAKSMASYKQLFGTYASHPGIVIYILSNELPTSGARGAAFSKFLTRACAELKKWDPTRQYIGNAGYGEGREGDIQDVHRYWGWYYNTFLTFYNLRNQKLFGDPSKIQPLTFTECLGCFTGPNGEFNIIVRKQLGAALTWTGHSANQRDDALDYQAAEVGRVTETFRRLRPLNNRISGVMPFTIGFANWAGITNFDQMHPNPSMDQFGVSYQPVLLSWEMWTPQRYAGCHVQAIAHVINDSDDFTDLTNVTLAYELRSRDGKAILESKTALPDIPYYAVSREVLNINLPSDLETGDYVLSGKVFSDSREVSHNETKLYIAQKDWPKQTGKPVAPIYVFDPSGGTASALAKLGVSTRKIKDPSKLPAAPATLIIGENAWDSTLSLRKNLLEKFVADGGRILCLQPDPKKFDSSWLPSSIRFFTDSANSPKYPTPGRPYSANMNINPERTNHPVFAGLDRHRLELWSDYTGWDQTKPGFPQIYPVTSGFCLTDTNALAHTAILADYDRGLEGVGLCEMFSGKGSIILCGFDIVRRSGFDPVADKFLLNLVNYATTDSGHDAHPLIEKPILWGNYSTEQGVITGPLNGLVVNADWVVPPTDPSARPLAQEQGWWNTRPSDQFVPHGRSPFGPYTYSTSSSLHGLTTEDKIGTGVFWARIPPAATTMITKIKNPGTSAATLDIIVNDKSANGAQSIAPGEITLRTPLPAGQPDVSIRYTGTKALVILETGFQ